LFVQGWGRGTAITKGVFFTFPTAITKGVSGREKAVTTREKGKPDAKRKQGQSQRAKKTGGLGMTPNFTSHPDEPYKCTTHT